MQVHWCFPLGCLPFSDKCFSSKGVPRDPCENGRVEEERNERLGGFSLTFPSVQSGDHHIASTMLGLVRAVSTVDHMLGWCHHLCLQTTLTFSAFSWTKWYLSHMLDVRVGWNLFLVWEVKGKNIWFLLSKKQQLGFCAWVAPLVLLGSMLPGRGSMHAQC